MVGLYRDMSLIQAESSSICLAVGSEETVVLSRPVGYRFLVSVSFDFLTCAAACSRYQVLLGLSCADCATEEVARHSFVVVVDHLSDYCAFLGFD